jgi:Holliday junction resolvase RusA-like endonuclease
MIRLEVLGTPAPQGSKRAFVGKSGRAQVIEQNHDRIKSWRGAVVDAVVSAAPPGLPMSGPLQVVMVFGLRRPKSHYRTGKNAHLLRPDAPAYPQGTPDLSKLARATEDALTDAGVWDDDARVVHYMRLSKVWCPADVAPGATIIIERMEPASALADARAREEVTA